MQEFCSHWAPCSTCLCELRISSGALEREDMNADWNRPRHPRTCALLYSISCLLDAADGWAARKYNQSSSFGAVLDMVTDRCCTVCLRCCLARTTLTFQGLSASFPCARLPTLQHDLPASDLAGHLKPLHSHVLFNGSKLIYDAICNSTNSLSLATPATKQSM
jgi:hypothetical protein